MNTSIILKVNEAAAKVESFLSVMDRSHAALHDCLAACLEIYRLAKDDEGSFTEIAGRLGVEVTGDASEPLALLAIKAIFHNACQTYDLRRHFSKWSMAIVHLEEVGVSPEEVTNYLQNGGVARCVNLYRKAHPSPTRFEREVENRRRIEKFVAAQPKIGSVVKMANGEQVCVINNAEDQKTLDALAQQPGRVLLLGRVDANEGFNLSVTCIVEREEKAVEQYLLRKARAAEQPLLPKTEEMARAATELPAANDNWVEAENQKEVA